MLAAICDQQLSLIVQHYVALTVNTAPVNVSEAVPESIIFPETWQLEVKLIAPEAEINPLAGRVVARGRANAVVEPQGVI